MNEPTLQVNLATGSYRHQFDGREYLIVPTVALKAGVVNQQLAPLDEISRYVEAWNGRPLPVRHPRKDGKYVTANQPDVIANQVVGHFYNARLDGEKLLGELWIDVEKAQKLGGDALTVLNRLEAGEPVEVSTAYFSDLEPGEGVVNGKQYVGIQRNLRPDHIALLPDEVGACSWKDGCGAPRVNCAACQNQGEKEPNMSDEKKTEEVEIEAEAVTDDGDTEAEAEAAATEVEPVANRQQQQPADIAEFRRMLAEFGGVEGMRSLLSGLRTNAEREKAGIIGRLVANTACAFTREDLAVWSVEQLEKLERSLLPASYAGRAGGFAANQRSDSSEWVEYERPQA